MAEKFLLEVFLTIVIKIITPNEFGIFNSQLPTVYMLGSTRHQKQQGLPTERPTAGTTAWLLKASTALDSGRVYVWGYGSTVPSLSFFFSPRYNYAKICITNV